MSQDTQQVICPHCSAKINFAKFRAEHNISCPACRNWFTLPEWAPTIPQETKTSIEFSFGHDEELPPLSLFKAKRSPLIPKIVVFVLIAALCFALPFWAKFTGLDKPASPGLALEIVSLLMLTIKAVAALFTWILPWAVARFRKHPQHIPILIFSVAFGWLFTIYLYANFDGFMLLLSALRRHGDGDLRPEAISGQLSLTLVLGLPLIVPWVACLAWACWPLPESQK